MEKFFEKVWKMIVDSSLLNVVGAIAILLVGWLIALVLSRKISKAINELASKRASLAEETDIPTVSQADTLAGKIAYYIIMILTVLGCFSVLRLNAAAAPLQEFISSIARYAPNIAGALLLLLAAWIIAGIVRAITKSALIKNKLNIRLAGQIGANDPEKVADYTAKTAYYTVFLFFIPAILNALKIYGVTAPLQAMFEKILTYLPNLIASAAILIIGLWVASIVRKAISGLVVISRLNAIGEQLGISKTFGNNGLASMCGIVSYILVALPVVISALTALQIDALSRSVAGFFDKLLNATGDVIGAALLVFAAVLVGNFAAGLVTQLTANFGLDKFIAGMGFKSEGKENTAPSVIAGKLAFLSILLMAILAACDLLGFRQLADLIRVFAAFGGNILLSIAVLLIGIWLASFVASALEGKCGKAVITGVKAAVIIFTVAIAVSNMNIGDRIVEIAFSLILGAACVACAIAFGVGGREAAAKILNDWVDKLKK
ncbi:MAG: mechanosensitive ion channel [Lentisphaeria bacterium]|nr:mechanosensitive ion channel [Lentisphaeria bacterium]